MQISLNLLGRLAIRANVLSKDFQAKHGVSVEFTFAVWPEGFVLIARPKDRISYSAGLKPYESTEENMESFDVLFDTVEQGMIKKLGIGE